MSDFERQMREYLPMIEATLANDIGDWVIKGFIDTYSNIYTISADTKVISKLIELMLFPLISEFARRYDYELHLAEHQNHYPDVTFIESSGDMIAFDLKSTYRANKRSVSGLTLGAFTGYFRERDSTKNISFPYHEYKNHYVLGIIYSRNKDRIDEQSIFELEELQNIQSVAHDFETLLHEKWKIASDKLGSGNTKNIGSIKNIKALVNGDGVFAKLGEPIFNHYWRNYLTKDMARAIDSSVPYKNLREYWYWRKGN
ncbi:MAG: restriction endonuclease [Chloroflexota bacterium]|nr:restriction endonuclease [Chloroflexota bacterium]MDE2947815.1 restriction endonuclease [Chloroflexota bacterium]